MKLIDATKGFAVEVKCPRLMFQFPCKFSAKVTRPVFLYQSKLEFLGVDSLNHLVSCGFRPIDVLVFSVSRLCSSANAAGVRSAKALCGRS